MFLLYLYWFLKKAFYAVLNKNGVWGYTLCKYAFINGKEWSLLSAKQQTLLISAVINDDHLC